MTPVLRRLGFACLAALACGGCGHPEAAVVRPLRVFGDSGGQDGEFHMPRAVAFSPGGAEVYLLDRSHRLQVFDLQGRFRRLWWTPAGSLGNPRGLDVGSDGRVYVADTHNNQVLVYSPEGRLLRKWGAHGTAPGRFICVTDVAVDPAGNVWTCEYGDYNDRIQKFDPAGRPLLAVGRFGRGPLEFSRPQGLAAHPDGRVFVADAVNHRVQVLTPEGRLDRLWGEVGEAPGRLRFPYDVALDRRGRVYVAEFGNSRISVFTAEGRFLASLGRPGRAPGEFDHPWGVNVDAEGRIYVADTLNYRVQVFPPLP